jgi:hypothetical protein
MTKRRLIRARSTDNLDVPLAMTGTSRSSTDRPISTGEGLLAQIQQGNTYYYQTLTEETLRNAINTTFATTPHNLGRTIAYGTAGRQFHEDMARVFHNPSHTLRPFPSGIIEPWDVEVPGFSKPKVKKTYIDDEYNDYILELQAYESARYDKTYR